MKIKTTLAAIAAVAAGAVSSTALLMPAHALAYTSQADCESFEGAGKCSYCVLGAGDGGWHRSAACGAISVAPTSMKGNLIAKTFASEHSTHTPLPAKAATHIGDMPK